MSRSILVALCALVLILPSCDSAEDDGSFRGTLTLPDGTTSVNGDAYYTEERDGAASTFVLFLTPNDLEDFDDPEFEDLVAVVIRREGARPERGVYPIFDPDTENVLATAFYLDKPVRQSAATMIAEAGSFQIDEINDDGEIEGIFEFDGMLFGSGTGGPVQATVSGEFDAVRVVESDLPELSNSLPGSP